MIVSIPGPGGGKPRRIASYTCYTWIIIQVVSAGTVRLSESDTELMINPDGAQPSDGLQLNQANTTPPFCTWWKGDLWAVGSAAMSFMLQAPGSNNSIANVGGGVAAA